MIRRTIYYLILLYQTAVVGQNATAPDPVLYDTLNPKLKWIYKLVESGHESYYYASFTDSKNHYQKRSVFLNGTLRSKGSCNLFGTLKTKQWDKQGRLISRSKQHPFKSTSYTRSLMTRTYNTNGRLVKFKRIKYHMSCFEYRGIYRYKIIEYDDNGKRISKKRMGRIATWREWKKTGRAVKLSDRVTADA